MVSSSSSSPKKIKTSNFSKIQQTFFKKPSSSSSKVNSLAKRQKTVFRKASELSTLCGIEVCVISYGTDGELKTWPEDRDKVRDMARRYSDLSETKRRRGRVDLVEFLEKINKDDSKKKKMKQKEVRVGSNFKYPNWDPRFDNYSVEQLTELIQSLAHNRTRMQQRIEAVLEAQKQRNMADQEQRMKMTNSTILQQQSNQVSMYLFNHGNGTLSQIPVTASAFNQAQSLAPVPNQLTICPNSNLGNYSGLLGIQGTGINETFGNNMLTCNNFNVLDNNNSVNDFSRQIYQNYKGNNNHGLLGVQETEYFQNTNMFSSNNLNNMNMGSYSELLGVEESGINGLQSMNMNMYGYSNNNNNTNVHSHQLVQFPTQTGASGFNLDQSGLNLRSLYEI